MNNIQTNNSQTKSFDLVPSHCPKCNEPLQWEGVHLICTGSKCLAKIISLIYNFYSEKGLNIDGIGKVTIERLLANENIYQVLSNKPWALLDMKTYNLLSDVYFILGEKTFANITEEINQVSNTKTMVHFIVGLGLPGLGYKNALRLCQYIKTGKLNHFISDQVKNSFVEAMLSWNDAFKEIKNFSFAPVPSPAKAIYCVTGTLSMPRNEFIEYLNKYNYENTRHINKETNYLIVGSEPGVLKRKFAKKHNIPEITEEQIIKLLEKEN